MAQSRNALVKGRVDAGAAYLLDLGFGLERDGYGLIQLLLGLRYKLYLVSIRVSLIAGRRAESKTYRGEQHVESILSDCLLIVLVMS